MRDVALIATVVAAIAACTYVLSAALVRRRTARRRVPVVLLCGLLLPVGIVVLSICRYRFEEARHAGSDGPAMALVGSLLYAAIATPFSVAAAWAAVYRRRVRTDGKATGKR